MVRSSSGLGRCPFQDKDRGSNPLRTTKRYIDMGCHTWFYKKINTPSEEDMILCCEIGLKQEIYLTIKDKLKDKMDLPPLIWTISILRSLYLNTIKRDDLCNIYADFRSIYKLTQYVKNIGFFEDVKGYHDLFRIGNYPEDTLHSLQDTLEFIFKYNLEINSENK